ncbi:hypothetical protein RJ55_02105 [Drechmeria coniospora]|nr:hypothetical protein RJ55_02105 [Drechmeria coniospora]
MKYTNALVFATLASAGMMHRRRATEEASASDVQVVHESGTVLEPHPSGGEISIGGAPSGENTLSTTLEQQLPKGKVSTETAPQGGEDDMPIVDENEDGTEYKARKSVESEIATIKKAIKNFNWNIRQPNLSMDSIMTTTSKVESRLKAGAEGLKETVDDEAGHKTKPLLASLGTAYHSLAFNMNRYVKPMKPMVEKYGNCSNMQRLLQAIRDQFHTLSGYTIAASDDEKQKDTKWHMRFIYHRLNEAMAEFAEGRCVDATTPLT